MIRTRNRYSRYTSLGITAVFLLLLSLVSCEKEVHINLNNGESQLVVQGAIETGLPPYVILSKSIGYSPTIDLSTLANTYVHGAVVTVSDGSRTVTLREYQIDSVVQHTSYSFYIYSVDSADPQSLSFVGQLEHYYTLHISFEGKDYTSTTKIPNPKPLDSLWAEKTDTVNNPDARVVWFKYTDPDSLGNCFRYFTSTNRGPFYPWINSVFNDDIINGSTVSYRMNLGYDHSKNPDFDSVGKARVGDTVVIKWCAIDKAVYNFYNTLEYSTGTVGSPFVSPVNVKTNMNGGALGIWAGYGTTYKTIIIPL